MRLVMSSRGATFRFACKYLHEAMQMEHYFHHFYIGELVLASDVWPFGKEVVLTKVLSECKKLHTIHVNPEHADTQGEGALPQGLAGW